MRRLLIPIALAAAVLATAAAGAPERSFILRGTLAEVVDGDTVSVRLDGGGLERVRLIGIDTPERGECYAGRATGAARALAGGRRVELAGDETQDTRDRYGRLLAYVYVGERFINAELVRGGFATTLEIAPNDSFAGLFDRLQQEAGNAGNGLWSAC